VELDVDDLVGKRHETDEHAVHEDRNYHELSVEANKRLILLEAMLLNESLLDGSKEVPIEASIDEKDENLGDTIPNFIDTHKTAFVSMNLVNLSIMAYV